MSNIHISSLNLSYGSKVIFDNAELNIDLSWQLGLVGRNGRGKTSLLKLLAERIPVSQYFPQTIPNPSQLTFYLLQDLIAVEQWQIERELNLLKVDLDCLWRPFESLSGGEKTKCLLALLFLDEGGFSLIDEPTNHLDQASREDLLYYLNQKKSGFIIVSHDRDFLNRATDHTLAIERQDIRLYQGNYATYEAEKALTDQQEASENQKHEREIARLKLTARSKADWSGKREKSKNKGEFSDNGFESARAARMMKKSKQLERRLQQEITEKEGLLKNIEKINPLTMNTKKSKSPVLLSLEEVILSYDQPLFEPVSLDLKAGDILSIEGPNGSGKTSLLKAILSDFDASLSGEIKKAHQLKISYLSQNQSYRGQLRDLAEYYHLDLELFYNNLRKLGLERKSFEQAIESMSQGEQKRVALAKSLTESAELYLWDEPLNYLDVFNQDQLIDLIHQHRPSMILIEHDRRFLEAVRAETIQLAPTQSR
ncbi:ribosomal protection-like ABC-F family protein [Lactococcus termiticola]|uniref:ATPase component of ABC transporter with duplicated ATPase domains n=1 Tax=Lactococcus termiticola TaxID=2169526 RepID=A0A2R5HEX2_9LACT|nr:ATP-binding cassette domain-containing protein [Lactococcus termiticola]GBG96617.1 ATPase component of ABC transporter with duplicated ATPase domains [Lactococcus termiticola]